MALSFLLRFIVMVLLAGIQHGTSGREEPEDRQGALRLPDGSVLTPYGQGHDISPQNPPGYSPAIVPYPYFPEPYPHFPEPYPHIPEPFYYQDPLTAYQPLKPKSNFGRFLLLLYAFSGAFNPVTTPATTTTAATAFPGTCVWGAWSDCSTICKGIRTRQRMCTGNTQMDSEICNTETGFKPDGKWYRASNCYEYFWSAFLSFTDVRSKAEQACTNLGSRLASTGLRDDNVRTSIQTEYIAAEGPIFVTDLHVGISDASVPGVYIWSDGYEGNPLFWANGEPDPTGTDCIVLNAGNPYGLTAYANCDDEPFGYLCERPAQ